MPSAIVPLDLSRIGLGCVTFGREIDEPAAQRLLDHAIDRGVTLLDTAAAYSGGESESIIGRWIESRRPDLKRLTLATKIIPPYEPRQIAESVARSLERLGVSHIDLLYLHRWDATAENLEALSALNDLVQRGMVRALGVSNYLLDQLANARQLQEQHGLAPFQVVQNNHNFAVREAPEDLRDWCADHSVDVVTYSPLGAGFLTGKHQRGVQPGSRFAVAPGHQDVYFQPLAYERLAALEDAAGRTGQSQVQLALAWALHQPKVTSVLIGGRSPAHLDQAFAALACGHVDLAE